MENKIPLNMYYNQNNYQINNNNSQKNNNKFHYKRKFAELELNSADISENYNYNPIKKFKTGDNIIKEVDSQISYLTLNDRSNNNCKITSIPYNHRAENSYPNNFDNKNLDSNLYSNLYSNSINQEVNSYTYEKEFRNDNDHKTKIPIILDMIMEKELVSKYNKEQNEKLYNLIFNIKL